jgi:hypothetical protein
MLVAKVDQVNARGGLVCMLRRERAVILLSTPIATLRLPQEDTPGPVAGRASYTS